MSVYFLLQQTMYYTIPLMVVALGGLFAERSGVINIALEGIMIFGGFVSIYCFANYFGNLPGQLPVILAMVVAALAGMLMALLHAYASINMRANQVISGTAINLLAPAMTVFIARMITPGGVQQIQFASLKYRISEVPLLSKIPVLGDIFFKNAYITTYVGIAVLILSWLVIYKTKFGLRLRSCGEHPQAADSVGISVYGIRYAGTLISGALAGLGGFIFIFPISTAFNHSVEGYGFLALAVLIFGQWKPWRIAGAAFFFGLMKTVAVQHAEIGFLSTLSIDPYLYKMIPYIATLLILIFTSRKSMAPQAEGIPYDKGAR